MNVQDIISRYIDRVAYSAGFDIGNTVSRDSISEIMRAGIADMQASGVRDEVLESNPLVLTTLVIFVTDNLNMTSGSFVTSPMYVSNVAKLRMRSQV